MAEICTLYTECFYKQSVQILSLASSDKLSSQICASTVSSLSVIYFSLERFIVCWIETVIFCECSPAQLIGCCRACAVHLHRVLRGLPVSKSAQDSHHVPLQVCLPLQYATRRRPARMRELVLHAAVTTSACDVIKLLPVDGRLVKDVSDAVGRTTDVGRHQIARSMSPSSRSRPRLVVSTSACDVRVAADKLLPVAGRCVADLSSKDVKNDRRRSKSRSRSRSR